MSTPADSLTAPARSVFAQRGRVSCLSFMSTIFQYSYFCFSVYHRRLLSWQQFVVCLSFQTFICLFNIHAAPDMVLFTSPSPDKPKGERPRDFCFPAMHPTAVLPANLLIFAACMQEVSGAVTLQQVPEARKKKKKKHAHTNSITHSNTL